MKACPFVTVVVASLLACLNAGLVKAQTTVALLEYTNVWRYQTNTNAPGYLPADAWTASAFNDQTWPSGPGLFGFETSPAIPIVFAPIHTMILPPVAGGPISSYFRTHFDWRGPLDFVVLDFASAVDDGMIVYLNGRELLAFNMPPAPRPMVWDLAVLPGGPNPLGEGVPVVTNIVPSNLREGDNVIAVELHQHLFTTGDDLFGMKLTATLPQAPVNLAPDEPSNRVVLPNRDFTMIVRASASPPPDYRWFGNGEPIPGATGSSYTVTNQSDCSASQLEPHRFFCRVSNPLGSFDTREAVITFVIDTLPPLITGVLAGGSLSNVVVEFSNALVKPGAEDAWNYSVQDAGGAAVNILQARLAPSGRAVFLTLERALAEGASYRLLTSPWSIFDRCNNAVPETVKVFPASPLRVNLVLLSPTEARLDWAGSIFTLQSAPAPAGPWTNLEIVPGAPVRIDGGERFFRLSE